jgi:hypothetical protein
MNKLNSKTTRIVSALALSAGLFSVSNSAMAASCSIETSSTVRSCYIETGASTSTDRKVYTTATATDKITGQGVKGLIRVKNKNTGGQIYEKTFVGSTNYTHNSQITGQKYYANLWKGKNDGRTTKLKASVTLQSS